jgi:hypothetical protein
MIRLLKARKGAATDAFADMFFFFVYFIALLLFILFFSLAFGGCKGNYKPANSAIIGDSSRAIADELLLHNYLRTSASEGKSFSELIAQACLENNFDTLKTQTKVLMESENPAALGILTKLRYASVEGPAYKRLKAELFVRCDPAKRARVLIYKTEKNPGCTLNLDCSSDPAKTLNIPLPVLGADNYAQLIMSSCNYLYPTSAASSAGIDQSREACV